MPLFSAHRSTHFPSLKTISQEQILKIFLRPFDRPTGAIAKVLFIAGLEFMKKALALLIILFSANALVSAKSKRFVWEDEICAYEGRYNAALYTEKQLENTYRLWYSRDFELDVWQGERQVDGHLEPTTTAWLDYQYALKSAALKKLEIVNAAYWQNVKRKKLEALERKYILERLTLEASENLSVLKSLKFAVACTEKFVNPLIAGDASLLRIWRESNEQARKTSAYAPDVKNDFEARMASADRVRYARAEVLKDGWWNCVNNAIERGDDEGVLHKNFRKLFRRVKQLGCDYA
jgi:hypothetical protein